MIRFVCSNCGRLISVEDKHSGKKGKCPKCSSVLVVPQKSTIIEFVCENCEHKIKAPERHADRKGACPKCKNPVVVPSLEKTASEAAETFSIVCSVCEETIRIPETSRGQTIECPACGSYIEILSGGVGGKSDASIPPHIDEERYQEETEEYGESESRDRQLIVVISSLAAVVVVGLIILAAVLRPSGSRPIEEPSGLPDRQPVVDTDSRPQPATSDTQPTEPIVQEPQQAEKVHGLPERSLDDYESVRARAERARKQKREYERRQEEVFIKWAVGLFCGLALTFLAIMIVKPLEIGDVATLWHDFLEGGEDDDPDSYVKY